MWNLQRQYGKPTLLASVMATLIYAAMPLAPSAAAQECPSYDTAVCELQCGNGVVYAEDYCSNPLLGGGTEAHIIACRWGACDTYPGSVRFYCGDVLIAHDTTCY